jgi:hypothetical protein
MNLSYTSKEKLEDAKKELIYAFDLCPIDVGVQKLP